MDMGLVTFYCSATNWIMQIIVFLLPHRLIFLPNTKSQYYLQKEHSKMKTLYPSQCTVLTGLYFSPVVFIWGKIPSNLLTGLKILGMATNMKVRVSDFTTSFLVGVVNCSSWAVMSSFEAVIHQTTAHFGGFITL